MQTKTITISIPQSAQLHHALSVAIVHTGNIYNELGHERQLPLYLKFIDEWEHLQQLIQATEATPS